MKTITCDFCGVDATKLSYDIDVYNMPGYDCCTKCIQQERFRASLNLLRLKDHLKSMINFGSLTPEVEAAFVAASRAIEKGRSHDFP